MLKFFEKVHVRGGWYGRCMVESCESNKEPEKFIELPDSSTTLLLCHLEIFYEELWAVEKDKQAPAGAEEESRKREDLDSFTFQPDAQLLLTDYVQEARLPKYKPNHPRQKRFNRNLNMMQHNVTPFWAANSPWTLTAESP